MTTKQKYLNLYNERQAVLDEIDDCKKGFCFKNSTILHPSLIKDYTYLDDLFYILSRVNSEIAEYEYEYRKTVYVHINSKLPIELVCLISDFVEESYDKLAIEDL